MINQVNDRKLCDFQSRKLAEERRTGSVDEGTAVKAAQATRSSAEGSKLLAAMESMSFDYK